MQRFHFTLWLADDTRDIDDWSHAVYEAGGDDSTCGMENGKLYVAFHRDAASLEDAIRTAQQTVRAAGLNVLRLEMEPDDMAWAETASR